jgi:glycosyltransferase involved in cell wall biosynthesis
LSRQKQRVERLRWRHQLESDEKPIFQSFYYGLPPHPDAVYVPMIVDMIQERFPHFYQDPGLIARKAECARRADRIITISETSKRDIVDIYGISPDRVDVIYLGVDPAFLTPTPRHRIEEVRERRRLPRPYFLQIGGRAAHKNFPRLLDAYARVAPHEEVDLVCAGEVWAEEELAQINTYGLGRRVHLVHRPAQPELIALMHGAEGLLYPSLYEGFGIPPVEAMASGIPVAASNAGSIGEIVGDAAALFDPESVDEMVMALQRLRDPNEARELHRRGQIRFQAFDWDRIADQTMATYHRAVADKAMGLRSTLRPAVTELS